jgi:hypothetical protein
MFETEEGGSKPLPVQAERSLRALSKKRAQQDLTRCLFYRQPNDYAAQSRIYLIVLQLVKSMQRNA